MKVKQTLRWFTVACTTERWVRNSWLWNL